jgi:hypothetical protein
VTAPSTDESSSGDHGRLVGQLERLRRRRAALAVGEILLEALLFAAAATVVLLVVEALAYPAPAWRVPLVLLALAGSLGAALVRGRPHWRCLRSLHRLALDVEERAPELRQRLITALQHGGGGPPAGQSSDLLAAVTRQAGERLADLPGSRLAPTDPLLRRGLHATGAVVLLMAGSWWSGEAGSSAWARLLHPTRAVAKPQQTHLRLAPDSLTVIRGDDAELFVHLDGEIPATMRVTRREAASASSEEVVLPLGLVAGDSVRIALDALQRPLEILVDAGDGHAGPIPVAVLEPPAVSRLRLAYSYPEHAGQPPRVDEVGGDIRALAGTRVTFDLHATKRLQSATVVVDDSLRLPASVVDASASVDWVLPTAGDEGARREYRIELVDDAGVVNRDPIRYAVHILADAEPAVAIPVPGADGDLPESARVSLEVEATDDYGVARVDLVYRINDGGDQRLPLSRATTKIVRLRHLWDLSGRDLLPEDRVTYWAEATDNDALTGPKTASSQRFTLRFPSLYELYAESSTQQDAQMDQLQEIAEEQSEARQTVEQLRRDVLRTEEMTWEQRQELESTLVEEEARARQIEELAQQMSETMQRLAEGGLSSSEVLDKMDRIRELMAAVTSPEMMEALQSLQQAMESPDPDHLAEALQRFAEDQQAFHERLDRTLALLQQVRAEQRLMAAVSQSQDLHERQTTINAALDSLGDTPSAASRLGEQEASLARDTDRLEEELQGLQEDFAQLSQSTAEALAEQAQQMAAQQLSGRMRQMQQSLEARSSEARREGAGLEQDLAQLSSALSGLQSEFDGGQRQEMSRALHRAMAGLVDLSRRQESLTGSLAGQHGPAVAERATEQQALARGVELVVEQIGEVGERTMALDPGLATTIGYALMRMERAALRLGQRDAAGAEEPGTDAVGFLNEAVLQLRQSVDNLQQASTPSAFGEAMERMMGLSQQQMSLNEATQQAMQDGSQAGRQGQRGDGRGAIPRLAAEQRRIYRALEELERSVRGQRSMEERVRGIREDVEGVLSRMERNVADPLVRQGQQRVLQRMLDASRSINNRGFEKQRRSERAEERLYSGPEWLPADLGQQPDALAEAMRRALAGDYPPEYRQLIRRYYESVYRDLHEGDEPPPSELP